LAAVALICVLFLASCAAVGDLMDTLGIEDEGYKDPAKTDTSYPGGVAVDEPRAALIGRDILTAGGTAADAAAAVYFALSVTLPSHAALGGGGSCLVWNYWNGKVEALDFTAPASQGKTTGDRPSAVPANVKGFAVLQQKYGRLRWSQVVAPAEAMARFGYPVSRTFSQDLARVRDALLAEQETRRIFSSPDAAANPASGGLVGEGQKLIQIELAGVLGMLRQEGAEAFYQGPFAERLASAARAAGGTLESADLAAFRPRWQKTIAVPVDFLTLHFTPPPAASGAVAADTLAMMNAALDGNLANKRDLKNTTANDVRHLFAESAMRAFAARDIPGDSGSGLGTQARAKRLLDGYRRETHTPAAGLNPPPAGLAENPNATGFVAVDGAGSAVACTLTMNNLFGTGRIAPGTGILLAARPDQAGRGPGSLGAMVAVDHQYKDFYFAASATGGVTAPTAMAQTAAAILLDRAPLDAALARPRLHHGGAPDLIYHEQDFDAGALDDLVKRGHRVAATPEIGRVNAAACTGGLPFQPATCAIATDPRGSGLAATGGS